MLRALGALALLLGMLAGALWATRRFDLRLPGRIGRRAEQRLELVERLTIDQRRSAVLIRCDGREHLVIIAPEGHVMVSSADTARDPMPDAQTGPEPEPEPESKPEAGPDAMANVVVQAPPSVSVSVTRKRAKTNARWRLPPPTAANTAPKMESEKSA